MDFYKTDEEAKEAMERIKKEEGWNFENLVFEGGGAKVVAYVGGCKILEELGVLQKCKRFAGTSGGAIIAALLATEHTPDEMWEKMQIPMKDLLIDSWKASFLPKLWWKFGWCKAKPFLEKMKEILHSKTHNADITFKEVYDKYGKELCIVATNVTTSTVEFFHPKTTPDMSVATAVRCSVSLPVVFEPVEVTLQTGLKQLYVDGGVVLNYPLHVFDGWALSMKPEHSILKNLNKQPLFGGPTDVEQRTLGMNLYTLAEADAMKLQFIQRTYADGIGMPDTKLARKRKEEAKQTNEKYRKQTQVVAAANIFLQLLQEEHKGDDDKISLETFEKAVERMRAEQSEYAEKLFEEDFKLEEARKMIEANNGMMTVEDMIRVLEKYGFRWIQLMFGGVQTQPTSFTEFMFTLLNTCMEMSRFTAVKIADIDRTVGIFTNYIHTTDFKLEKGDMEHLIKQGQDGTIAYFLSKCRKVPQGNLQQFRDSRKQMVYQQFHSFPQSPIEQLVTDQVPSDATREPITDIYTRIFKMTHGKR